MDFSKLSTGAKIALIAGIVLIIDIFLPWYGVAGFSINAFDSGFPAWFGVLLGLAAVVVLALKIFDITDIAVGPFKAEQIALMLAALSTIFLLLRLVTETDFMKFGLFIGIAAAAALTYGSFMAMKEAGLDMPDMDDFKSFGGGGDGTPPPPPPSE
ncbi:MAG: hypothetical protein KQH83_09790 [Actinobacteria bacterium]|nr:hypothetical protein [Actinomycetota bacterium]